MTTQETFALAQEHHRSGRLAEAEKLYRRILTAQPAHAEALHYLGVVAYQIQRPDLAIEWIGRAIALQPANPAAHFNLGNALKNLGRIEEAIASYRRAIALRPHYPEAHSNLASIFARRGQLEDAIAIYRRMIELDPNYAEAHNNLASALAGQGRYEESILASRRALQLRPEYAIAWYNLGSTERARGQLDAAVAAFRRALEFQPNLPEVYNNLGLILTEQGQLDEAVTACRQALALKPDYVEAQNNLGQALLRQGRLEDAVEAFRQAIALQPGHPEAHNNLGAALAALGRPGESAAACRRALELKPDYAAAHYNLGVAQMTPAQLDAAVASFRQALRLQPVLPEVHNNLGLSLAEQGHLDEAVAAYREALRINPNDAGVHSNLIYTLHFHPDQDPRRIADEQARWQQRFGEPARQFASRHPNSPDPQRRLKIGYVSPDFRSHSAAFFLTPLLENHDHTANEIFCYANVRRPDAITTRLQKAADAWRDIAGCTAEQIARRVHDDGIDILVDLAMHTGGNSLPAFARRPAPVQVSWLAYPGSTGLEAIDYRLTDAHIDPPDEDDPGTGGKAVRLPECWCCYSPIDEIPPVYSLPAGQTKTVTFGSVNQFRKIHPALIQCWARLLHTVPDSRLLMICPGGECQDRTRALFATHGVASERLQLVAPSPWAEYCRLFAAIDLALDTYPCNGMTTTCHALWMGVPVVTLAGQSAISRAGDSLLHAAGLTEWVARDEDDYLRIAAAGASDLARLAELRQTLRSRMRASPLMDASGFAGKVEAAFRTMWRNWCTHEPR